MHARQRTPILAVGLACAAAVAAAVIPAVASGVEGQTQAGDAVLSSDQLSQVSAAAGEELGVDLQVLPNTPGISPGVRSYKVQDSDAVMTVSTETSDAGDPGAICTAGLGSGAAAACTVTALPGGGTATVIDFATRSIGNPASGPVEWRQVSASRVGRYPVADVRWTRLFFTTTDGISTSVIQYAYGLADRGAAVAQMSFSPDELIAFATRANN